MQGEKNLPDYQISSDFSARVKTAAIALLLTLPIILWGKKLPFLFLIGAVTTLSLKEFYKLTLQGEKFPLFFSALFVSIVLLIWGYYNGNAIPFRSDLVYTVLLLTTVTFSIFMLSLFNLVQFRYQSYPFLLSLFGLIYITIPSLLVVMIYSLRKGEWILFFILSIVWIGDTGAYVIGSRLGRHKLYPAVSPKKTIEGSLGSLIFSILASLVLTGYLLPEITLADALLLGLGISVASQLGDLSESLIKRRAGVKDSGNLFPGHGGMLDRIDSLLFAVPFVYFYLWFFVPECIIP